MKRNLRSRPTLCFVAVGVALALAGCGDDNIAAPNTQYGARPILPAPQEYLLPPIKVAPAGSWAPGETPTVAAGLKIQALATGLMHPRSVYVLPNGDILVVESSGPKAPTHTAYSVRLATTVWVLCNFSPRAPTPALRDKPPMVDRRPRPARTRAATEGPEERTRATWSIRSPTRSTT